MSEDSRFHYMACDYLATGEGRTICLMICVPYPKQEDYEVQPSFAGGQYTPGVLRVSKQDIAARRFSEKFGSYYAIGLEHLTREEFLKRWGRFVPESVQKLSDPDEKDPPGGFHWNQEFHYNFS